MKCKTKCYICGRQTSVCDYDFALRICRCCFCTYIESPCSPLRFHLRWAIHLGRSLLINVGLVIALVMGLILEAVGKLALPFVAVLLVSSIVAVQTHSSLRLATIISGIMVLLGAVTVNRLRQPGRRLSGRKSR